MKRANPDKVLQKFWSKAINEYWLALADAAPTDLLRNGYLNQILKSDLRMTPLTTLHPGEKGVRMFCPQCLTEYANISESKPAWCANNHEAVRVRHAQDIVAIQQATDKFYAGRMKRR